MSLWPKPQFAASRVIAFTGCPAASMIARNSSASNMRGPFAARANRSVFLLGVEPRAVPHRRGDQASVIAPLEKHPARLIWFPRATGPIFFASGASRLEIVGCEIIDQPVFPSVEIRRSHVAT